MLTEYYVYMYLREDGTPYYVGKGKKNRAYTTRKRVKPPSKDMIVFPCTDLTEEDAFKYEKDLIAQYGRKDNNTGILRNLTDGGEGASGYIPTAETLEKLRGRKQSPESIEKRRLANTGKKRSEEFCMRLSEVQRGRIFSLEIIEKMRQSQLGKKRSPEHRENIGKAQVGKKNSPETIEKMKLAKQHISLETIEKMRQSQLGKKHTIESREKMRLSKLGKKQTLESIEKTRLANLGRKQSPETIEKRRLSRINNKKVMDYQQNSI
jgi:hypothetical protein